MNKDIAPRRVKDIANAVTRAYAVATARMRPYPDFLIVGTKRGGTTSLWNYLIQHPQVLPMFPSIRGKKSNAYFFENLSEGDAWYRSHFSASPYRALRERSVEKTVSGEASPYYMYGPAVPQRIAQVMPDVKVIVLLRDPVDRAYGHYQERVKEGVESETFANALALESRRMSGEWERMAADPTYYSVPHDFFTYRRRGVYLPQIKRLFQFFARSQVLILKSEELYMDPLVAVNQVCVFLGIQPATLQSPRRHNFIARAPIPTDIRDELRGYYAPHNARLYDYLGRDFGWSAE